MDKTYVNLCILMAIGLLLGCGNPASQSEANLPEPPAAEAVALPAEGHGDPQGWQGFIPSGHIVMDTLPADLNQDGHKDMLLLVKRENEDSLAEAGEETIPRQLFILVHDPTEGWMLGGHSYYAVLQVNMSGAFGGDPYQEMKADGKGGFSIMHYGGSSWRWHRTTTFTYSPQDHAWKLYEELNESYHTSDPDKVTTTRKTEKDFGKVLFDDYQGE